jgi:hypothetical protein
MILLLEKADIFRDFINGSITVEELSIPSSCGDCKVD